jgi:VanZ family protein
VNGATLFRPWTAPLSRFRAERWLRLVPLILYVAGIYAVSSVSGADIPHVVDDRISHTLEYFGLALLMLFALAPFTLYRLQARHGAGVIAMAFLWGLSDEFHQRFVPLRDSSGKDLAFDVLGASLAVIFVLLGSRRSRA